MDHLGRRVGEGGHEIGHLAHGLLVGGGRTHELGVKAGAGHDGEAAPALGAVLVFPGRLAEVAAGRVGPAAGARERGRFGRVADVGEQEVGGARREHAGTNVLALEEVQQVRDGAVAAGEHDYVEVFGVFERAAALVVVGQYAQHAFVAGADQFALEGVDGVRAKARARIVNDEASHGILLSVRPFGRTSMVADFSRPLSMRGTGAEGSRSVHFHF